MNAVNHRGRKREQMNTSILRLAYHAPAPSSLTELSPRLPLISPLQLHPDSEPRPVSTISFLRLPAELRLLVYAELLVSDERLIPSWRGPRKASKRQKALHINILLTCKTCAIEGAEVLYGRNLFDFGTSNNPPCF